MTPTAAPGPSRLTLRDHLLASLQPLPNPQALGLAVLQTSPKRSTALFPHAYPSLRTTEREYLIVLHSALPIPPSSSSTPAPRVLTSALHAYIYTLPPSAPSPAPSHLIYISKLDSSGHSPSPSPPLTRTLIVSFLAYFLSPDTSPLRGRVDVTLFARSQGQYLFANSAQYKGKKVLGGLGLCQWWKGVYEEVVTKLLEGAKADTRGKEVEMGYVLPSYSKEEAAGMLGRPRRPLPPGVEWQYRPPFSSSYPDERPPLGGAPPPAGSLARIIPSLPDDPKTRFLDELVAEQHASSSSPSSFRQSAPPPSTEGKTDKQRKQEANDEDRRAATAALGKIGRSEFWERMGFRQEMSSGDVTGFFSLSVLPSNAVVQQADGDPRPRPGEANTAAASEELPHAILERLQAALVNCDFATAGLAREGSRVWLDSVKSIVSDQLGLKGYDACTAEVPAKDGLDLPVKEKRKDEAPVTVLQVRKKKRIQ